MISFINPIRLVLQVLLFLFLQSLFFSATASTVNVFFASGQSNAKAEWANAIQNTLIASGRYENVLLVWNTHPGDSLDSWYTNTPSGNYELDFFNPSGSGLVQTAISSIQQQGNQYQFSGFFWFQGEGDSGRSSAIQAYGQRFTDMLGQLDTDLGGNGGFPSPFVLALIDSDPAFDSSLPGGRAKDDINLMRQAQVNLANSTPFGNYFDTRGYERRDAFHLTSNALAAVGAGMATTFLQATVPVPIPATLRLLCSGIIGLFGFVGLSRKQ